MAGFWDLVIENGAGLTATAATVSSAVAVLTLLRAGRDGRERSRPMVVVSLRMVAGVPSTQELVVENVGPTVARDLVVTFDPKWTPPSDAGGSRLMWYVDQRYARPIASLAPGQSLTNVFQDAADDPDVSAAEGQVSAEFTASAQYRGTGRKRYKDSFNLDPAQLRHTTYVGLPSVNKMLEKIAKNTEAIAKRK